MINIYKLRLTKLQQEIVEMLFTKAGMSFNGRGIARVLNVSQPAVSKSLPLLEKEQLIAVKKDKETKRLTIELNRDNPMVIWLKRSHNLKKLYESGLVQLFYDSFPEATVILFGSYAFGEDTVRSDLDIAVIGSEEKDIDLTKFEKILERNININYYKSFKEIDKHLRNNILNGITLKGVVEL